MRNKIPHFITIGSSYAGASQLMQLLSAHPAVSDAIPSLQFFGTEAYEKKGVAWYVSQIEKKFDARLVGECSPEYIHLPQVPEQIVKDFPDAKLIVVIRNPIHRAISQFQALKATPSGARYTTCAEYVAHNPKVQMASMYGRHLHRFFGYYSALDLHVVVYEDLVANPYKVTQAVYKFLGLDEYIPPALIPYAPPPDEPKRRGLIGRTVRLPFWLFSLLKKAIKKSRKKKDLFPTEIQVNQYLQEADLQEMIHIYSADVALLSQLLHRDMRTEWQFDQA